MPLCQECSTVQPTFIGAIEERWENDPKHQPPLIQTCQLQAAINLPKRSKTCPLCALLYEGYVGAAADSEAVEAPASSYDYKLLEKPIEICFEAVAPPSLVSVYQPGRARYGDKLWIRSIVAFIPVEGLPNSLLEVRLRCYAEEGTPAAITEDITGFSPISSADCPEAHKRTSTWLARCRANHAGEHEKCSKSISGTRLSRWYAPGKQVPRLPTRVIDVGSGVNGSGLRLVESNGLSAHFWALSHCWGPREKQPPKTTKANLYKRLAGIRFETLPKTFRDAITFTRNHGVRYIWIDSLAIIQDSSEDWERESRHMAAIYEQADIVLVAADAENPQGGLFFDRAPYAEPVELPHYRLSDDGNVRIHGSYFVWLDPTPKQSKENWYKGPLSKRGWVLQEWFLSQRRIFFTRFGMYWECSDAAYDEKGSEVSTTPSKTFLARGNNWDAVAETYSKLNFTYLTDRLVALEGLRSRFPDKSRDQYYFGLWRNDLPSSLLWKTKSKANRQANPLKLPTWTWASVISSIEYLPWTSLDSLVQDFRVEDSGSIQMTALVGPIPQILQLVDSTEADPVNMEPRSTTLAQLQNAPTTLPEGDDFVICSDERGLIGVAYPDAYEADEVSDGIFAIALVGFARGSEGRKDDPNTAYRVLLARRSSASSPNKFIRVGAGKIFAKWLEDSGSFENIILE